jgi:hypothetical protein
MKVDSDDATNIRQYLLGELSEHEDEMVERRLLTDKTYFTQFLSVEERLTDEYASGSLSQSEKQKFEKRFLRAPERREDMAFARVFNRYLTEEAGRMRAPMPEKDARGRIEHLSIFSRPGWRTAAVTMAFAILLILAYGAWLLNKNAALRDQIMAEQSSAREREERLQIELAKEQSDNRELKTKIEEAQQKLTEMEREPSRQREVVPSPGPAPGTRTASLVLTAGLTRDSGQSGRVHLSTGDRLHIRLKLDEETHKRYRVQVQSAGGSEVWRQSDLKSRAGFVPVTLPASRLPENDYMILLSAPDGPSYERIAVYHFTVLRR